MTAQPGETGAPLSASAQRVQDTLRERGFAQRVIEMRETARTAAEAAQAVGCTVGQIAKSLVFKGQSTGQPILIIASGANRVDTAKVAALVDEPIIKPEAAFVRDMTGFAIGGIPPLGHREQLMTLIDDDLLQFSQLWAAAGNPNAVFPLAPADLVAMTGGRVVSIKE